MSCQCMPMETPSTMKDETGMSNLYVIRATNTDHYKIGITSRDVVDRLKELQTGNHTKLEVVRCYEFGNAEKVEQNLHGHFSSLRTNGEWFDLTNANLVDSALKELGHFGHNLLDGNILKQTKVKSASYRFDFSREILCSKDMGNFGKFIMLLWGLFVPLEPIIESIPMSSDDDFYQLPWYEEEDEDAEYQVLE